MKPDSSLAPKLDRIWQPANQQGVFRALMEAMARPGQIESLAPWTGGDRASRAVLATLLDAEVSLFDRHQLLDASDWPLMQAREAAAEQADYLLCDAARAPDFQPALGTLTSPDEAATLVLVVAGLGCGDLEMTLSGPGVHGRQRLAVEGLALSWLSARADWVAAFPLGVDLILADDHAVVGLPRTTRLEIL